MINPVFAFSCPCLFQVCQADLLEVNSDFRTDLNHEALSGLNFDLAVEHLKCVLVTLIYVVINSR